MENKKSKLYAFGDSFTNVYDDTGAEWVSSYIKWKGYTPKSYLDIISENYNLEIINFAKQGNDNYSILESFYENFHKINDDDLIIINWSSVVRFRVVNKYDDWCSMLPDFGDYDFKDFEVSKTTIEETFVNRTSIKYINEAINWIKFIEFICKNKQIIQWCMFDKIIGLNVDFISPQFETVRVETKGKIKDGHFSEKGNKDLSNLVKYHIEKKYVLTKKTVI